ncbi:MAG: TetR/AcrR family transcriptional regulator [Candidatus Dormibacteria bacterium]
MPEEIPAMGRRDRKRLATHQALQSAALHLVAERGLHQVTVEEIAEAADVSVRTFFNHFPSKEDALVGLDRERAEELTQALASRPLVETPLESLRAVLTEFALEMVERSDEWPLRMDVVKASPELLPRLLGSVSALEQALVEAIAARQGQEPGAELYPALVASVTMAGVRTAISRWRECNAAEPLTLMLECVFDQIAAGLPSPLASKRPSSSRHPRVASSTPGAGNANSGAIDRLGRALPRTLSGVGG